MKAIRPCVTVHYTAAPSLCTWWCSSSVAGPFVEATLQLLGLSSQPLCFYWKRSHSSLPRRLLLPCAACHGALKALGRLTDCWMDLSPCVWLWIHCSIMGWPAVLRETERTAEARLPQWCVYYKYGLVTEVTAVHSSTFCSDEVTTQAYTLSNVIYLHLKLEWILKLHLLFLCMLLVKYSVVMLCSSQFVGIRIDIPYKQFHLAERNKTKHINLSPYKICQ